MQKVYNGINLKIIPLSKMPFTTLGHWFLDDNSILQIRIVKMSDWRYEAAILIHELIEYWICFHKGITTKVCDEFDTLFEEEYKQGRWTKDIEAGFDKRCPYRTSHKWGARLERLTIWLLKASWKKYLKDCDKVISSL